MRNVSGLTVAGCVALLATASSAIAGRQRTPGTTCADAHPDAPRRSDHASGGERPVGATRTARLDPFRFAGRPVLRTIDEQSGRWTFATAQERQAFGDDLLRRSMESRIVSMQTELPLEIVSDAHAQRSRHSCRRAVYRGDALVFKGRHWQGSVKKRTERPSSVSATDGAPA